MRIFPLITAALVTVLIYFAVFQRDQLLGFAGVARSPEAAAQAPEPEPVVGPSSADNGQAAEPLAPARFAVVTRSVAEQEVDSAVLLRGRTEAWRSVEVRAETQGTVVSDPLRRGAEVAAGDLLCELAPGTRLAALAEARARLAEAQITFRAAERLSQDGFAAETRVAGARASFESAQAAVARAEDEIARLRITAPFAGLLESDAAETGALLQSGNLCARVIQLDPIRLVGFVSELEVERVAIGALAGARTAGGREVTGRVSFVSRAADPATRTFRVEVTVDNTELSIRDGMTADILIAAQGARGVMVPVSALTLDDGGRLGVRAVDGEDTVVFHPVRILRDTRDGVFVSGVPDGTRVIVVGQDYVTAGVRVRAVDEGDAAAAGETRAETEQ
jgi:membrane fusion protein, multidrug efflux system